MDRWFKYPEKIENDECKCLLILQLVVANSKDPNFFAVPSQINLHLINILQIVIMEDFNFHYVMVIGLSEVKFGL